MRDSDPPILDLATQAALELAENQADDFLWRDLVRFLVRITKSQRPVRDPSSSDKLGPPIRKRPKFLATILRNYATTIYFAEGNLYPENDRIEAQLRALAKRIVKRMMGVVIEVEDFGREKGTSLGYHGLAGPQMQREALAAINDLIGKRLPLSPEVQAQTEAPTRERTSKSDETNVERRAKLLSEYKAATGAKDYHIYNARNSGIYKPEFYQWRNGRLLDKSKVTNRFEIFLRAKRLPIPRNPTS